MPYLLVRLECQYGKVEKFTEIMKHLVPVLEKKGWRLDNAFVTQIGRLNRLYDLWEMPDANHVRSVLALAAQEPEFRQWAAGLGDCLISEELEFVEKAGYAH